MPQVRTDIVDVYVFRRANAKVAGRVDADTPQRTAHGAAVEFLQLRRSTGPLAATWQTVMGHVNPGETAVQTALRELKEETGFTPPVLVGLWQLEELNSYFLASRDAIMLSPCFAAEVAPGAEPALNDEHDAHRWVKRDHAGRHFVWPGQRAAIEGICRDILAADSTVREILRIKLE